MFAVQVFENTRKKSNFFSNSVFDLLGEFSTISIKVEIVVCKLFQFGRV